MRILMAASAITVMVGMVGCSNGGGSSVKLSDAVRLTASTDVGTAPMFAVSPKGQRTVAWVSAPNGGTDGRLYVSVAGGTPVEIQDSLGPVEAHGESPPQIRYAPDGTLYAVYTVGKLVAGERFPRSALRIVRSTDDGKTWSPAVTVNDGLVFGSHSFEALHVAADGTVYVSWLGAPDQDSTTKMSAAGMKNMKKKNMKMTMAKESDTSSMSGMAGMAGMSGMSGMSHGKSASWITRSTDGGRTWSPRVRVDAGEACPCCRTSLASTRNGVLYMAWRHVFAGHVRDVVVARSDDRGATWSTPVQVHKDDWHFDACPHAGPAIAVDSAGTLHVVWWTGKEGSAGVYYTRSTDGGKTFAPPTSIGVAQYSRPAHVQIAVAPGNRVIVAWDDGTKQIPQAMLRVSDDGGLHFANAVALSTAGEAATFPVLAVSGDSLAVAWSQVSAQTAQAAQVATANAKKANPMAPMGLDAVGETQVLVRRGVLE
jgi:hypothetical protein